VPAAKRQIAKQVLQVRQYPKENIMRKFPLWVAAALLTLQLSGCQKLVPDEANPARTLYASFPPIYALSAPIVKDAPGITLKCLVQPQDGCLRSYELSDWDEALLSSADAVILAGRGFESFGDQLADGKIAVVGAMDGLTLLNNGSVAAEGDEPDHFDDENPWAYLSVQQARDMCSFITAGMIELDPDYEALYEDNFSHFDEKLAALQGRMEDQLIAAPERSVAVAHEGLRYLTDELGLNVSAVVKREPGSELSDNDLKQALEALKASDAKVVLIETQAPKALRDQLTGAGYQLALIDTLSTHAPGGLDDYIETMDKNARAIADALTRTAK
jgi:zinc transport system substrate-binding protein